MNYSLCFRYNPCSAVRNCNEIYNVSICQTRKIGSYNGTWTIGQRDHAYFETNPNPTYGIDIVYPFIRPSTQTTDRSYVHVLCQNDGQSIDTFKLDFEGINAGDEEPQSAHFSLITRYACPPQTFTSTRTSTSHPSQTSVPLWLITRLRINIP